MSRDREFFPAAPHAAPQARAPRALAVLFAACVAAGPWCEASAGQARGRAGGDARQRTGRPAEADARARDEHSRQRAVAAIVEAADAARKFDDRLLSARVQTEAADALWAADERAARALFRRAWEAATAYDAEDEGEFGGQGGERSDAFVYAREEVIRAAARRDAGLAETLLQELLKAEEAEQAAPREGSSGLGDDEWTPEDLSPEAQHRLALAETLLAQGEPQRAAQLAAPAVREGASLRLVTFLIGLRPHSPSDADALFLRLLDAARADAQSGANDVLLLSSYVLSPELLTTIDVRGSISLHNNAAAGRTHARAELPARLRAAFYDAAAAVLLRPAPPPAPGDAEAAGRQLGLYFAVGRLLPFYEREAPRHAPAFHARLQSLGADIDERRRASLASEMGLRRITPDNPTDPLGPLLEALPKLGPDNPRADSFRLMAVEGAAGRRMWDRAQTVAETITQPGLRRRAQLLITAEKLLSLGEAYSEREEQDYELAARFVRSAEAPPVALAFGMARAAELASKRSSPARAAELLDEAARYAERPPLGTGQRAAAFAVVALAAAGIEQTRAWESLRQFARAANSVPEHAGESLLLASEDDRQALGGEHYRSLRGKLSAYDLARVFAAAGRLDLGRALEEARGLSDESARARALVAVARARLEGGAGGVRRAGEKK